MKNLTLAAILMLLFSSCKKEIDTPKTLSNFNSSFFQMVRSELKDSLSSNDYLAIDTLQLYKSKNAQSDDYFVRIPFRNKQIAADFVLLKTDSLGNIREGKIIHVDKANKENTNNALFQGQFQISSLDRHSYEIKQIVNGRFKRTGNTASLLEEEPAGTQDLPEVVVTSYSYDGGYTGDWYWYDGFYDYSGGGGGDTYTYGYSGGGGSTYSGGSSNNDNTIDIEVESTDNPAIKAEDYVKCFGTVPDANATYQISIFTDIPVDGDPSQLFNWNTNSPGHSFVQLTKTSGTSSVQQNFGFYPKTSYKSLGPYPTEGKLVDNGGHEYNASLTQTINSNQFQTTINMIEALQYNDYDISTWNCTDFALSVYNASTYNALTIPMYPTENSTEPMSTPQGLYTEIQLLQASGITTHGTPSVPKVGVNAGKSHGNCND